MKVTTLVKKAIDWYCKPAAIVFDRDHHNDMKEPW